jgi:hypothetical protein
MSALGQKQTFAVQNVMSALPQKRTKSTSQRNDTKCQKLEKAEDCRNK